MSDQTSNQEHSVPDERGPGLTSVTEAGRGASKSPGRLIILVLVIAGALTFLYFTWVGTEETVPDDRPATISPRIPFRPAALPIAPPDFVEREPPAPEPIVVEEPPEPVNNELLEASRRAPVIAFSTGVGAGSGQSPAQAGQPDPAFGFPPGANPAPQDNLAARLEPTELIGVRASVLPDLHLVVPQGTIIPCVLQTALASDQPGLVSCVLPKDVLSASGQVVLLEKGTTVTGEYSGGLQRGQKRIFVLWNRARTPRGVIVNLASPASDGLGRSGFDGKIDNKFWQRFGGGILFSVLSDATSFLFEEASELIEIDAGNTEGSVEDAASIALENSINIQPTLYKNQGDVVAIFTARDLDFTGVYDLQTIETRTEILDRTVTGNMQARSRRIVK